MDYVGEFHDKLQYSIIKSIPLKGKIVLPISGGLDSRILAGIVSKIRDIDVSYVSWSDSHTLHKQYAKDIMEICGVVSQRTIHIPQDELKEPAWRIHTYPMKVLNEVLHIKDAALVLAMSLDVLSGAHIGLWNIWNPSSIRQYEKWYVDNVRPKQLEHNRYYTLKYFRKVCDCVWTPELVKFCLLKIPPRMRFDRWILRETLRRYYPELAKIPQDDYHVTPGGSSLLYTLARCKFVIHKRLTKNLEGLNRGYCD